MTRRRLGILALALAFPLAIVVIGYIAASYAVYDTLSAVPGTCHPADRADTPQRFSVAGLEDEVAAEYAMPAPVDVEFRSRDERVPDLVLRAWWIPGDRMDGPAVLVVHGVTSCRRGDDALLAAGMLHRAGFGVLLMDQRDHGDSDDEDLRFAGGTEEYLDVLGAWDWLVAQGVPHERIGILGFSFGAATTVIAGGEEPRVQAVWADSSYADMPEALRDYLARKGYPTILELGGEIVARLASGDDLTALGPLLEMPNYAGRRLGITHGTADTTLPYRYAEHLRAAAEANGVDLREFWLVPGVEHTRAVVEEWQEYERRLVAFFSGALVTP